MKNKAVLFGNMLKNVSLQGSTLSDHRMTKGFGAPGLEYGGIGIRYTSGRRGNICSGG